MASLSAVAKKSPDLLDDDLDAHRVGGRLVTRREIVRSRRCTFIVLNCAKSLTSATSVVTQLADLFWNLECCEDPAVKPSIELAKLALVTSKDEEEEEGDKAGTDSSNDTDVTLVEDGSTRVSAPPETMTASPTQTSFSILGKRSRGTGSKMDIDTPDADKDKDYVIVSKPGTPVQAPSELPPESQATTGGDVEMLEIEKSGSNAPVRKGTTGMMFGAVIRSPGPTFAHIACRSTTRCFRMHGFLPFSTRMCRTDSFYKTLGRI